MIGSIKQGIDSENAKKITKLIRDEGPPKGVKAQIQATRSASAPRSATTFRPCSRCCGAPTSRSRCSSSTIARRRT